VIEKQVQEGKLSETLQAIQNMIYSDRDAKDIAEDLKHQGNEKMKHGKVFLFDALKFYTSALEQPFEDNALRATLFANRAQANLLRGFFVISVSLDAYFLSFSF
jgi:hypothetical protein